MLLPPPGLGAAHMDAQSEPPPWAPQHGGVDAGEVLPSLPPGGSCPDPRPRAPAVQAPPRAESVVAGSALILMPGVPHLLDGAWGGRRGAGPALRGVQSAPRRGRPRRRRAHLPSRSKTGHVAVAPSCPRCVTFSGLSRFTEKLERSINRVFVGNVNRCLSGAFSS